EINWLFKQEICFEKGDFLIYILDTNIISYIIRNRDFKIVDKFEEVSNNHIVGISSITIAELYYGIRKKGNVKLEALINEFLLPLERYSFDEKSAFEYGSIRYQLELKGEIIGSNDLLIAAHTKSLDATLVTNNTKEFKRVENLLIENWIS
ncbi:MAG: tRNA(fMet)-specific endonuclease VapC, partial [Campylobacterota bacterium]|nr:tRNA(fMet)-specific endonuclease VapC [Campylobacterota bacterium]